MRLIDVEAIKLPKGFFEEVDNVPKFYEWLSEQPPIDAVEVVRCRDCIHAKEMTQYGCGECVRHCEKLKIVTSPNWFCAEGRRKDEGGTD